ncbi:FAD binding domain-containing protein [Spirosoma pollinicola]|uniref:FAD-binding molybdopterin dehydrogenase n=1 Tax=Spirosoma pollinicola TaxID=2057025 RepID=A0A2K8Z9S4_9BACT|nr:xanthine dehydrogenase family protein subunit M [Spirosoma pollinicola]AUD06607.1 FAD-binding molybdopterin dehydrogenase [Spirosoma pollinicola]
MRPFIFSTASDAVGASQAAASDAGTKFLAGGTNLVDLMKEDVERPTKVMSVVGLPYTNIEETAGGVTIGAMAYNSDTANHPLIRQRFPLLTQAILAGASAQIRNMATNGGNLNQRTRCSYFYDTAMPCNKREQGSGCGALEGINRMHAIFGWSNSCVAVHPSDMCIALAALDARVKVLGTTGERSIPFLEYHRLPGTHPEKDNTLMPGELITAIDIPTNNFAAHCSYLKLRDRSSYAFALVSVAAALEINNASIKSVRIAMGGVAHKSWRATTAENFLVGKAPTEANFKQAATREMAAAKPLLHNAFKVKLGSNAIYRALSSALSENS